MQYVINLGGRYYFSRRVPTELSEYDKRKKVRFALKTDSKRDALRLAGIKNAELEGYWHKLVQTGKKHSHDLYEATVKRASLWGAQYLTNQELSEEPLSVLLQRYQQVDQQKDNPLYVEALLGGIPKPVIKLEDALKKYWEYSREKTLDKSPNQVRKWKNPRKLAIRHFINCVGNKPITELTRDDILKFKDWWIVRIEEENYAINSANKNFIHVKSIISTVSKNLKLGIDIGHLFMELVLEDDDQRQRRSFETDYILKTLLHSDNLEGLDDQEMCAVYGIAELGVGLTEQVNLDPCNIILDDPIPRLVIIPKKQKGLKTKYRRREIPLIGFALEAYKKCPNGLTDYNDAPDRLSGVIGKHFRERGLYPSDRHTLYSLRHSFQDRLLEVNAPDRVQADLMGHKFTRESYGKGATLEKKLEWLEKIKLKP
ncbi:MAG TPA: hypothetical protein PLU58_00655 [Saprospiraceae bacterium]|nr:hypothetical protein [Saprospiraceae bacterium]